MDLGSALGLGFLGGLVLNVMPCVLPVLTLKAFSLVEVSHADAGTQRRHGVGYLVGTVTALLALAAVVLALRAGGRSLGWGMQFQHPGFVATLVVVLVVFGLNALGVFEIAVGASGSERGGFWGSVGNGWFAAIMATPCSAPFLGSAAAFAMADDTPPAVTLAIFGAIGAGLASPFVLLSFVPSLSRRLPRPGAWMESFKALMGFTLLAAAVWLFGSLQRQLTPDSANRFLFFLLAVALGLWSWQRWTGLDVSTLRRWGVRAVLLAGLVAFFGWVRMERRASAAVPPPGSAALAAPARSPIKNGKIDWVHFEQATVESLLREGRPVFLDYTADWCASCQANDKLFVDTPAVHRALESSGVVPVKVDMTEDDATRDSWLKKTGRNAIPVYVVFYPGGDMDVLPVAITSETLIEAFHRAAARVPPPRG